MTRWFVLLAAGVALLCTDDVGAQTRAQKAPMQKAPAQKGPAAHGLPLHVYLAKGEANACGEGCSEWIAVEGRFDSGSTGRVIAFLQRHGARKLPVFFYSPGGDGRAAIAIGRFLRARGMTAGVGKTVPIACTSASDMAAACRAAKRSAQAVAAEWQPDGVCNSACVFAVIGGKARQVPPSARLGVHSVKLTLFRKHADGRVYTLSASEAPSLHKTRVSQFNAELRRYIVEMGIDAKLFDAAARIPHEDVHYLSRDEIAGYGIDRREFAETPWFIVQYSNNNTTYLNKWIVEARGPERKDHRISLVMMGCGQQQRVRMQYVRGLASGEVSGPVSVTVSIGDRKISLSMSGDPRKRDPIDTGVSFASAGGSLPLAAFESLAAAEAAEIVESDPVSKNPPRVIKLSTERLGEGIKTLVAKCAQSAQPASWVDGTQVPYVPGQKGSPAVPAAPYGAYPVPELGLGTGAGGRKKK
jgi:hypothetical protein